MIYVIYFRRAGRDKHYNDYRIDDEHNSGGQLLVLQLLNVTISHYRSKGVSVVFLCSYHNHSSPGIYNFPGVLQLPWCATTSQWNMVQLPFECILLCYNSTGVLQ